MVDLGELDWLWGHHDQGFVEVASPGPLSDETGRARLILWQVGARVRARSTTLVRHLPSLGVPSAKVGSVRPGLAGVGRCTRRQLPSERQASTSIRSHFGIIWPSRGWRPRGPGGQPLPHQRMLPGAQWRVAVAKELFVVSGTESQVFHKKIPRPSVVAPWGPSACASPWAPSCPERRRSSV